MLILTNENKTIDLNLIGNKIKDIRFSVFDYSTPKDPDYFFKPLVFLESFNDCCLEFSIGKYRIRLPKDWAVVMADPEMGEVELISVEEINNRDFHAFVFNPLTGFYPKFLPVKLEDLFLDVRWVFPKLEHHNFLVMPLSNDPNPDCIFLINEKDQKKITPLSMDQLL